MWVEFVPGWACGRTSNTAMVQGDGLTRQDTASLRVLPTIARVAGFAYHDDNDDGQLNLPCVDGGVDPAGCEPGVEGATAQTILPDGQVFEYTTNTSGWFSFNLLDPGTYHVTVAPPEGNWWTPNGEEECDAVVVNKWDEIHCHVPYRWGAGPRPEPVEGPRPERGAEAQATTVAEMTLIPVQDAAISAWDPGNHGAAEHLEVRQPGVTSSLLQFDLSGLPEGAQIVSAKLRLYSPTASNGTNRLYMTAYPLDKPWSEADVSWLEVAAGAPWDGEGATGDHGDPVGWAWLGAPGWVEFDLDPSGLSEHGLLVRGEGSENREVAYLFLSREYEKTAAQPQLVVGYEE
jgi:hypothetical protein